MKRQERHNCLSATQATTETQTDTWISRFSQIIDRSLTRELKNGLDL